MNKIRKTLIFEVVTKHEIEVRIILVIIVLNQFHNVTKICQNQKNYSYRYVSKY